MENKTNLNDVERFNAVDVLKVMEMIKKPSTNFDRITASPEALAKVIMRIVTSGEAHGYNGYCLFDDFDFDEFMKDMKDYDEEVGTKTEYEHYKEVLMWLKQESKE